MGKLFISPLYGLCNKLRTIVTSKIIAEHLNYDFYVTEWLETDIKPGFNNIFIVNEDFNISDELPNNVTKITLAKGDYLNLNELKNIENIYIRSFDEIPIGDKNLIYSPKIFSNIFTKLKLLPEIKSKILILPDNTIGMHIRRSDNQNAIQVSTTNKFIDIIKANPKTLFFLATDDQELEFNIKKQFSDQIITQNKVNYDTTSRFYSGTKRTYDTPMVIDWIKYADNNDATIPKKILYDSMIESVVDLYTLSQTKKMYGSYGSSFSKWASYINNNELIIVK